MQPNTLEFARYGPEDHIQADRELARDFFEAFSRFEYALKREGAFTSGGNPDWDKLAKKLENVFDADRTDALTEATRSILEHPPFRQGFDSGELKWKEPPREGGSKLMRLTHHIKDMRNNLFHGGKSEPDSLEQLERNNSLLKSGLTVLAECLQICETEWPAFYKVYKGQPR